MIAMFNLQCNYNEQSLRFKVETFWGVPKVQGGPQQLEMLFKNDIVNSFLACAQLL